MNELKVFLQSMNLGQYTDAFLDAGYDDVSFIRQLTIEEFEEMLTDIEGNITGSTNSKLKAGHKKKTSKMESDAKRESRV